LQRQEINLGSKTNQKFVQIPTGRLKDRIAQLCDRYGIRFVETEESYASKAQAILDGIEGNEVVIATTNVGCISMQANISVGAKHDLRK
jgi:hypothetical protein